MASIMMARFKNPSVRLFCSYLFDWIACIILLALFFLLDRVEPFHRDFSVQNTAILFPHKTKEIIPIWALVLMAVVFPVLMIVLVGLGVRRSPYDVHNGILGLLVAILLTTMFTQVIKVTVGKHRPDFISRCQPMMNGAPLVHDEPLKLWSVDVCSQTDHHTLRDGMRSFPSGHSSTAFAGLVYIALWMAGKMHVFDRRGYSLKGVILIVPVLAAMLVAISRIQDYRHSATDVTWGSIIGLLFAFFAYFQYYPSLLSTTSEVPHPPRDFSYLLKDSTSSNGNGRHRRDPSDSSQHLEHAFGIRSNDDFVDESDPVERNLQHQQRLQEDDQRRRRLVQQQHGQAYEGREVEKVVVVPNQRDQGRNLDQVGGGGDGGGGRALEYQGQEVSGYSFDTEDTLPSNRLDSRNRN